MDLFSTPTREQLLHDLFVAYYGARLNKRNTHKALAFEIHDESNLIQLCDEIFNRNYQATARLLFHKR